MAWLPHADQGGLPVPRLDPGGPHRARPGSVSRPGAARGDARNPGMAELLLQVANDRAGAVSGARSVHSVHEAEKHTTLDDGRGFDYALGTGILRLSVAVSIPISLIG